MLTLNIHKTMSQFNLQKSSDGYQVSFDNLFYPEFPLRKEGGFIRSETAGPKVNIKENNDEFVLELAAPGLQKSDFRIQLADEFLNVSSEQEESGKENQQYYKREFTFKPFRKVFTLPETADVERISAKYLNGVLQIMVPKREDMKPRPPQSIPVN